VNSAHCTDKIFNRQNLYFADHELFGAFSLCSEYFNMSSNLPNTVYTVHYRVVRVTSYITNIFYPRAILCNRKLCKAKRESPLFVSMVGVEGHAWRPLWRSSPGAQYSLIYHLKLNFDAALDQDFSKTLHMISHKISPFFVWMRDQAFIFQIMFNVVKLMFTVYNIITGKEMINKKILHTGL
jgi:hypothetical protein